MTRNNKVCSYCIMDTTVPDIFFDDKNQCQYCKNHIERIKNEGKISSDYLNNTVNDYKEKSKIIHMIVSLELVEELTVHLLHITSKKY